MYKCKRCGYRVTVEIATYDVYEISKDKTPSRLDYTYSNNEKKYRCLRCHNESEVLEDIAEWSERG